jgi:hypothetical protein
VRPGTDNSIKIFLQAIAVLLALWSPTITGAQSSREYEIKAAFLYNFSQYIEWPSIPESSFRIAITGVSPITEKIRNIASNNKIKNRPVTVTEVSTIENLEGPEIIYIPSNSKISLQQVLMKFGQSPVLIITEDPGSAEAGANINFVIVNNRLKFEFNVAAANLYQFHISSNLLKHAILVKGK